MLLKTKQDSDTLPPRKWDWVEPTIWTERMLAALDNGVKGNKWFSLWDKLIRKSTLEIAWKQVKKNKGSAGIDKVTIDCFSKHEERYLEEMVETLSSGKYQPQPIKRVNIPKEKGKNRPLGIPTVKDRIIQTALVKVIEPIFEKEFKDMSYGFRPRRGCKDALREVDKLLKEGYLWVVDADIQGYFDNIPKTTLMNRVEERISDGKVLNLIEQYLQQPVMEALNCHVPQKGTPQGAVASPLLANIYLHPLDELITQAGYKMIRYADDFIILCKTEDEAKAALSEVRKWTQENGLTLHPEKTHLRYSQDKGQGFEFLGYLFETGKKYVRKKSLCKLRDAIRLKTKKSCGKSINMVIHDLNPMLRGWFEYFKHADKLIFSSIDSFVRRRLRSILRSHRKQSGGTGRNITDHIRWPNKYFANLGLFTITQAFKAACQSR